VNTGAATKGKGNKQASAAAKAALKGVGFHEIVAELHLIANNE
jgi:hypothetical protein